MSPELRRVSKLPRVRCSLGKCVEPKRVELRPVRVMKLVSNDRTKVPWMAKGIWSQVDHVLSTIEVVGAWVLQIGVPDEPNRVL